METNYETQAAAATDLGGIEIARKRLVITIGLGTITYNPECTAIIMAAGEAKAGIVADAVQGPTGVLIPASALRSLANARFYLTTGAARQLRQRQVSLFSRTQPVLDEQVEMALVDLALARRKRVLDLTPQEVEADAMARLATSRRPESLLDLQRLVHDRLIHKIEAGCQSQQNVCFLHTEPHHDDLMLGCMALIVRNIRNASNVHHFLTLTSGFTAVTNRYMLDRLYQLKAFLAAPGCAALHAEGYFDPRNEQGRNRDIWLYLDGIAGQNAEMRDEGAARRLLRNLFEAYEENDVRAIPDRIEELLHYFESVYPGKKDQGPIQQLKGMCREWEAECLWGYFGWQSSHIHHLRLGFYTGDVFSPTPTVERDVRPIMELLALIKPDVVSVAFDPEGSGPDTHYKVLQAMNEAVQRYARQNDRGGIRILGYRNVWYRFHPAEANLYVPVSLNMFSVMESAFLNTFVSQRNASFPSHELDGPFCQLAQRIQVEQYQMLKTCLGREWFAEHPSPLIRATRGLVFLHEMNLEAFSSTARNCVKWPKQYHKNNVQPLRGRDVRWKRSPGCAARPWAVLYNPFGVKNLFLPRRGYTPQPRVAQRTLGTRPTPGLYPEGVVQPLQGRDVRWKRSPGCAARPWAVLYNPFGVKNLFLPRRGYTPQPRVAQCATLGCGV